MYASAQDGLAALEPDPEWRLKYADFIDAYAHPSEDEWQVYRRDYLSRSTQKETLMGMLYYSRQEGRQESRQEGLGSERRALLKQIRRLFGEAAADRSDPLWARIQQPAIFEQFFEHVLECLDATAWQSCLTAVALPPEPPAH
ncbi:MAG: hypothetical protein RKP73_18410 [Candidatus Contendobacter sp.]|nr:hypothetical protein [Candidatus Contendobacter sp.]